MENILDSLNVAQRAAVSNGDGPMLVVAGAGSGKTRVLTMRIAYQIQNGVDPRNILALTFTNKAAGEMKERIAHIVGPDVARKITMGTFHSVFARILREEAHRMNFFTRDFTIYDTTDSKSAIKNIVKSMKLEEKEFKPDVIQSIISSAKNELMTPRDYASTARGQFAIIADIYQRYIDECRKANALDFDDLLVYTNVLFRDNAEALAKYQDRFRYILVDEYQDTNESQYVIVKRLASKFKNICVVGDDAQSIYSFRGAKIENILKFQKDYPGCKVFKLEQNYRSTQNIVNAANAVISNNVSKIDKTVFSENSTGEKVHVISTMTDSDEARTVVTEIERKIRSGENPFNFAILYRNNFLSSGVEKELHAKNIPYKIYSGIAFYQRKEIKDVIAYMRLILNPTDNESLRRIINYPARSIGPTTQAKIQEFAVMNSMTMFEALGQRNLAMMGLNSGTIAKILQFTSMIEMFSMQAQTLNVHELTMEVLSQSGILADLQDPNDPDNEDRLQNVNALVGMIKEFCDEREDTGEPADLATFLATEALATDQDTKKEEPHVSLMTIHGSKGLEYENIHIIGVEDEIFPGNQSALDPKKLEEERRLFYVAITRAKRCLTISYAKSRFRFGSRQDTRPSRFIAELPDDFCEKPSTPKRHQEDDDFYGGRGFGGYNKFANRSNFDTDQSSNFGNSYNTYQAPAKRNLQRVNTTLQTGTTFECVNYEGKVYKVGMIVDHEKFGRGRIESIIGNGVDTKVKVTFTRVGEKQLLLKLAKLNIVG